MSLIEAPEFLVCTECESPCYTFDWNGHKGTTIEALCTVCGNDSVDEFETEDEYMAEME